MTTSEGDRFAQLAAQMPRDRHDLSTELLVSIVLVAWLMVLFAGYLAATAM
jgi:hypothetical protein